MSTKHTYSPIDKSKIPPGVRFDVPRRHQGQIVEYAYGGFSRAEHDRGDLYMRYHDQSDGTIEYFKLDALVKGR